MSLILLHITSFIYIILLAFFYFRKSRLADVENKIYKNLLISNIVGLLIEFGCFYGVANMDNMPLFASFITRLLLIYYLYFISMYTSYVFVISYKKEKESMNEVNNFCIKTSKYCLIIFLLTSAIVSLLPLEYYYDGTYTYSYGTAVTFLQLVFVVIMGLWSYILIKKYKNIKVHKYLPVIIFILLAGIGGIVQKFYPYILLTTPIETLIIFLMYHTIENPDMKLLKEVHKSKEISDNANEEKTMFLYNMTQDIRKTTSEIDDNVDIILDSEDIDEIHDYARDIKGVTSKFNSMTNDILDISKLDDSNIKIYNSKYNIKTIIKEFVTMYGNICNNRNIDFRTNIDHNIPDLLYGDSIGLKEAISIILDNSSSNTKEGYIEFNVNTIIKNNVCRLIITIEDSGTGIKSEDLEKVKIKDKSLGRANKLITLMGGTMILSSNYGYGTKVKIILDQKIEVVNNEEVDKYSQVFDDINLLMVDDSEAGIKIIEKLLKGSKVKVDSVDNGKDCLDLIKIKKYDIILIDEELSQITGAELLKKIKSLRNFKTPVVLLTKDNNNEYNEEYKKLGFNDYLLKPVKKNELMDKINECIKRDK